VTEVISWNTLSRDSGAVNRHRATLPVGLYDLEVSEDTAPTFGQRVAKARRRLSLSQRALADKCGYNSSDLSRWERDLRGKRPSAEAISRLSRALHVHKEWLETGAEPMEITGPIVDVFLIDAVLASYAAMPEEIAARVRGYEYAKKKEADAAVLRQLINAELDGYHAALLEKRNAVKPQPAPELKKRTKSAGTKPPRTVRAPASQRKKQVANE
jgi:transcriptional regulator with XRE-family HTH domain